MRRRSTRGVVAGLLLAAIPGMALPRTPRLLRPSTAATRPGCSLRPRWSWSCCRASPCSTAGWSAARTSSRRSCTASSGWPSSAWSGSSWVLLAFAPDLNGWGIIGGLDFAGFMNVGLDPSPIYGTTIPFVLFAASPATSAAITPALITGAFAERKRFASFVILPSCGPSSSTRRSPTGSGRPTAGCTSSARLTSPGAPSSTRRPVSPP